MVAVPPREAEPPPPTPTVTPAACNDSAWTVPAALEHIHGSGGPFSSERSARVGKRSRKSADCVRVRVTDLDAAGGSCAQSCAHAAAVVEGKVTVKIYGEPGKEVNVYSPREGPAD